MVQKKIVIQIVDRDSIPEDRNMIFWPYRTPLREAMKDTVGLGGGRGWGSSQV